MNLNCSVFVTAKAENQCKQLTDLIQQTPRLNLLGSSTKGVSSIGSVSKEEIDLLFFDIDVPEKSDLKALRELVDAKELPKTILTAKNGDAAVEAFSMGIYDYLLKPFTLARFSQAVNRFFERAGFTNQDSMITIKTADDNRYMIKVNEITHIKIKDRKAIVYAESSIFETKKNLKDFMAALPQDEFIRVHRQYIVNMKQIERIKYYLSGRYTLYLKNGSQDLIPVGARYAKSVRKKLGVI